MPDDPAEALAADANLMLVAAAGCGKTETIARAAGSYAPARQLVLTHTHAGVRALKDRIARVAQRPRDVHVDTIAGFCLRYAMSYPKLSGADPHQVYDALNWPGIYEGAIRVADSAVGRLVLSASYSGLFVDEYQDCTVQQHQLVMAIAEVMPARIVLDPLQAIFGFDGSELVSAERDLGQDFDRLPDLETPHRWAKSNPQLGDWLTSARQDLEARRPIKLAGAPVQRGSTTRQARWTACRRCSALRGSVVAIGHMPNDVHALSRTLQGRFTAMEPVDSPDLMAWARKLEAAHDTARATAVIEFAKVCMTEVGSRLGTAATAFAAGRTPSVGPATREPAAVAALAAVATNDDAASLRRAMRAIDAVPGRVLHRRELWTEMDRALARWEAEPGTALVEHAWRVRDVGRHRGRRVDARSVSRTLLIKGLEFDHALVLDADKLDTNNLYVAMTRGSSSLTVLSAGLVIRPTATVPRTKPRPRARTSTTPC